MTLLALAVFLPIPASDSRFVHMDMFYSVHFPSAVAVLVSIFPLCAILGYLTPRLIDNFCQETRRRRAGRMPSMCWDAFWGRS